MSQFSFFLVISYVLIWQLKSPHPREIAFQGEKNANDANGRGGRGGGECGRSWNRLNKSIIVLSVAL